jgi:hypothetical protein
MRMLLSAAIAMMLLGGCGGEYAEDWSQKVNSIDESAHPEVALIRDMLAAAVRYDIDSFARKNEPRTKNVFLSILDADPADALLERLEGAALEVHKFSEWARFSKNEEGQPALPKRYLTLSVRDIRLPDSTHAEVDTIWHASGIEIPGETLYLQSIEGTWQVMDVKLTPR